MPTQQPTLFADKQIARVGVYSARKMVAFAKAFIKARKESSEESAGEGGEVSAVAMDDDSGDEGQEGDDEAEQATTEVRNTPEEILRGTIYVCVIVFEAVYNRVISFMKRTR